MKRSRQEIYADCTSMDQLHEIGATQSNGYLFVLKQENSAITLVAASDNFSHVCWLRNGHLDYILGKSLQDIFDDATAAKVTNLVDKFNLQCSKNAAHRRRHPPLFFCCRLQN
jgi:hypothetical protein